MPKADLEGASDRDVASQSRNIFMEIMKENHSGYTILELTIVMLIVGILFMLAIPNLKIFLVREEREITLDQLSTAITYARNEAFLRQKSVSLCGSDYNQIDLKELSSKDKTLYCHQNTDWSTGYILFENETSENQSFVKYEKIIQRFPGVHLGKLIFTPAKGHPQIHIHPNGMTLTMDIGHFLYSPKATALYLEKERLICNRICRCRREVEQN